MKIFILSSLSLLLPWACLSAAEPGAKPPSLAQAPNPGRWTVTTRTKGAGESAAPRIQVTVEKSGQRRRETMISALGGTSEKFFIHGLSFRSGSGLAPGDVFVETTSPGEDFPELTWIKPENFVATRREGGKSYHVYQWSPPVMAPPRRPDESPHPAKDGQKKGSPMEAWVDAITLLPARILTEHAEKTYQFTKPTDTTLEPTGDIRRRIELYFDGKIP